MPISSTNSRLTRELYKPPPRSLEQIRMQEVFNHQIPGSPNPSLKRERHLDGVPKKKTAVVGPVTDNRHAVSNGFAGAADPPLKTSGGVLVNGGVSMWSKSAASGGCLGRMCCICHGYFFTRCCILAFLIGLLLGALITGLVVGLIYAERAEAAGLIAAAAVADDEPVGCLQSPCPSASATCAYSMNDTLLTCNCRPGPTTSTAGINAGGYVCNFFETMTTAVPVTVT
uniref:Uncharacterized LOC100183102 n=1 Tax=Ciona intestinalis TaxID=7719 RepID=A0A1W5B7S8_CIOIN|nr:uncharacterized protein LOC100183102 [Ciona intestinalis]|eukprot:XP_018666829.1 uncharacterized protein LOC100183102 [Ciona intestinalis]